MLEKPLDELSDDEVFKYVPLVSRMATDIQKTKELTQRQRDLITKDAVEKGNNRNPEVRIDDFDNSASITIRFTDQMDFPEGTLE